MTQHQSKDDIIADLQRQMAEAMGLLRELADLQNGAPLPKYEQEWEACMLNVHKVLTAFEATPEPPIRRNPEGDDITRAGGPA